MDSYFIKILFIEDNDFDAFFYQSTFARSMSDNDLSIDHVKTLSDAESMLKKNKNYNLVVLDLNLPDSLGVETLSQVIRSAQGVPVIVLSGIRDMRVIEVAREIGAAAFFVKGITDKNISEHILEVINNNKIEFAPDIEKLNSRK